MSEGYIWDDKENINTNASIKAEDLPDTIKETNESILNETIGCSLCSRAFKITQGEFGLLQKMNLPAPHHCPKCRENARFNKMNLPGLYDRSCMKCGNNIKTPFAPERPEIVYCEKCYQQEFI